MQYFVYFLSSQIFGEIEQCQLLRSVSFSLIQIVIADYEFGEFLACFIFLYHAVYSGKTEQTVFMVQLSDFGTIVIRNQPFTFAFGKCLFEPEMILPSKTAVIDIFACKIRRITIEKRIGTVIVLDEHLEVLILNDCVRKSCTEVFYEGEQRCNVKRLTGKGFAAA